MAYPPPKYSPTPFFYSTMSSALLPRSSTQPAGYTSSRTRGESTGTNRESPDPTPSATRNSEEPEDKCVLSDV